MNFFKRGPDRPGQDDLARQCRQFYQRRLQMAQEASQKWSDAAPSSTASPRSTPSDSSGETKSLASSESSCSSTAAAAAVLAANSPAVGKRSCSTLPRKLKSSKVNNSMAKRSVDDFLMAVDKEAAAAACSDSLSSATAGRSDSFLAANDERSDLFDPEVLPSKISQLRQDLLSLINLDNELFKHLLTINDTLEELREQRNVPKRLQPPAAATADFKLGYYEPPDMVTELLAAGAAAEDEYVGPFTSLPDHTYMLQKQQLLQQQQQQLGTTGLRNGLKFMLRSRSFLMKPIIAKRRVSGTSESTVKTKIPVKVTPPPQQQQQQLPSRSSHHQPASLPHIQEKGEQGSGSRSGTLKKLSLSSKKSTFSPSAAAGTSAAAGGTAPSSSSRPSNFNRPLFHLPHQSKSKQLWQKVFEANANAGQGHDEPDGFPKITHMKQNSYDSGIHHGSESSD